MNKDLEKEIMEYAYTLPHSSTGVGPRLKHYDEPGVMEAKDNGWKHSWDLNEIMKIADKAIELTVEKAKNWIQKEIAEDNSLSAIMCEGLIDDFNKHMKG